MNKTPLINALRNVARRLETSSADYDWHSVASCNCGLVAQELLKLDGTALNDLIRRDNSVNGWFENSSHGWSTVSGDVPSFGVKRSATVSAASDAHVASPSNAHMALKFGPKMLKNA